MNNGKKQYRKMNLFHDGTWWEVLIVFPKRNKCEDIISYGKDAFPPEFKELLECLDKLIGKTDLLSDYMESRAAEDNSDSNYTPLEFKNNDMILDFSNF